jgi:hypothetical protein
LDLAFIRRDREREKVNGSVYSEGIILHELIHSAYKYKQYVKDDNKISSPRIGFGLTRNEKNERNREKYPWGNFLEEGFAEFMKCEYAEKNIDGETNKNLDKKIREMGFDPATFLMLWASTKSGERYEVSRKYWSIEKDKLEWGTSSLCAEGLEILCEKIPELRQVMIEARSDINKLREIPKLINAIKPGLYTEIQKCEYTAEDFIRVQNIIKEAIEDSK